MIGGTSTINMLFIFLMFECCSAIILHNEIKIKKNKIKIRVEQCCKYKLFN